MEDLDGDIDDLVNFSRYRGQRVTKMMKVMMMMIAKPEDQESKEEHGKTRQTRQASERVREWTEMRCDEVDVSVCRW